MNVKGSKHKMWLLTRSMYSVLLTQLVRNKWKTPFRVRDRGGGSTLPRFCNFPKPPKNQQSRPPFTVTCQVPAGEKWAEHCIPASLSFHFQCHSWWRGVLLSEKLWSVQVRSNRDTFTSSYNWHSIGTIPENIFQLLELFSDLNLKKMNAYPAGKDWTWLYQVIKAIYKSLHQITQLFVSF